jgi:putative hemolysin
MNLGLVFALLLLAGAYFSGTELAVTMASRVRLRTRSADGQRLAHLAERVLRRRERTIALCLVGNNLVHVGLAVCGREVILRWVPMRESLVDALATLFLVPLVLFVGEILPKAVAQNYPNRTLMASIVPLLGFRLLLYPLLLVAVGVAEIARRLVGVHGRVLEFASREEIKQLVAASEQRGHVDADERQLVERIVEFWRLDPATFVRPLSAAPRVSAAATVGEAKEMMRACRVTRLPVTDADGRDVVGVVSAAGIVAAANADPVRKHSFRPVRADPTLGLDRLLGELQRSPSQVAVMEGTGGIIRLDDLLRALLGPPGAARGRDEKTA